MRNRPSESGNLADHAPRGNEDIHYEDMILVLGFADIILFNKGLKTRTSIAETIQGSCDTATMTSTARNSGVFLLL